MQSTVLAQFKMKMRKELKMLLLGMKFSIFLLLVALQVSARSNGQVRISLTARDASLESVLKEISRQSGMDYAFTEQFKEKANKVDISVRDASIEEALVKCFQNQPFTFTVIKNTIVIKPRQADVSPSNIIDKLAGKVINNKGEPIEGAAVSIKGTNIGTNTGYDGSFFLRNVPQDAVLAITSVGYYDTTVSVDGRRNINVLIRIKLAELEQAVISVSTGYQQIPKERATGSFAFVNNQLFNRRVGSDVLSRLEGVVPGLLVNRNVNTVNNANGIDISIRGYSTLFANGQPLIVVDNFPYDGNINNINPNDIDNITILKDAAASSIWGVQSGNGVIVITTKKGKRNEKMQIEANANLTFSEKPNLFYSPNFVNTSDFIAAEQYAFTSGFYDNQLTDPFHPPVSPAVQIMSDERDGLLTSSEATSKLNALKGIDVRKDLSKYFYQRSVSQQYSINLRGGGLNNDYIFSLGYDRNRASTAGDKAKRFTLNSILNFYPVKNLVITTGFNFIKSSGQANSPVSGISTGNRYASNIYPYAGLVGADGQGLSIVKDYNYSWVSDPTAQSGLMNWKYNPLDELKYADNTSRSQDIRLNFGLTYTLPKGFGVEVKYQYENTNAGGENYYSDSTYFTRNLINQFTNLAGPTINPVPIGGIAMSSTSDLTAHRLRGQLNYNSYFSASHNITAIIGSEVNEVITETNSPGYTYGYDKQTGSFQNVDFVDYFPIIPSQNTSQIPNGKAFDKFTNRYVSYYSNASYSYLNKYTVTASGRIDKSNLFGVKTNQKSVPLYSLGTAWNFSKEKFYNLSFLPYGRLRATFGYTGNINKSAAAVTTIHQLTNSLYTGLPYATILSAGNPQLRWEKMKMINFGYDFATKNNVVSGSIEYYIKKGIDLFGNSPLAPSTGLESYFGNTANTKGNGVDVNINIKIIKTKDFEWSGNLLYSYATDKVTKYNTKYSINPYLLSGADASNITPRPGSPIFSVFSFRSAGLTHDEGIQQGYLNGKPSTDLDAIVNQATIDSLRFNGSARPTHFGSLRNTITFRSFSLSANIIYKLNYYFRRSSINYNAFFNNWAANRDISKRWQQPGDELKTSVPSMPDPTNISYNSDYFYTYSDVLIDKGDHIRLQDINLSYTLKGGAFNGAFKSIQLYFYVNNVAILWKANKDHLDPDAYGGGFPAARTYSIGIKTNL
jgi:TonB-linked SusC/RagA family outer membrane protein